LSTAPGNNLSLPSVVICSTGVIGTSIAWHLASRGGLGIQRGMKRFDPRLYQIGDLVMFTVR
jgi:hypothetical protein